ncbi:hypothetical protein B4096_2076 [Heyndrickxia coagulans]|uniref:Uncharacterized protein n=1 Tax=Heyndrickxia coagulans TaxID=1398 RepID=A0AAN0T4G0_HEYCO|nr:hypothetical protein BCO26_2393 [Heyndrickxia coagulans 2-6]AJO21649.1 hypothetical protein SB48_HM08orf01313 [Heyndrickxia coagulans]KYC77000.1 hypothetical protein B4096_2076 [Heyndrickxia coagulans]
MSNHKLHTGHLEHLFLLFYRTEIGLSTAYFPFSPKIKILRYFLTEKGDAPTCKHADA